MAKCVINKDFIMENIYETAFEVDKNVIIADDVFRFSSNEKMNLFKEKVEDKFGIKDIKSIVETDDRSNIAVITETDIIEQLYSFENRDAETDEVEVLANLSSSRTEYKPADYTPYIKYLNNVQSEIERITSRIKDLRDSYKNPDLSSAKRREIENLMHQYSKIRGHLIEQKSRNEKNMQTIVKNVEESKKLLEYIVQHFGMLKEPNLVETARQISEDIENLLTELGSKKYAQETVYGAQITDQNDTLRILRASIHQLKVEFDRKLQEMQEKTLATNPILLNDEKMRQILNNPRSDEYKRMFGGADIADIGFLQYLGLNVDTSSTFDGVLGKLLMNEFDRIAQDNNNESIRKKRQLLNLAKKFKEHNINLESSSDTDFLFEKDANGERTGNFTRAITYEFTKKLADFYKAMGGKSQTDLKNIGKAIKNELDYINIFRLGNLYVDEANMNNLEKEFLKCCRFIFKETHGDEFTFDRTYLNGYDSAYEKSLLDKFDKHTLDLYVENFMSNVIEYYYTYKGQFNANKHANPFEIMTVFDKIKNGKSTNIKAPISKKRYRIGSLPIIPAKEEDYSKNYQKNILGDKTEVGNLKRQLYAFVTDVYTDFNLLYTGRSSLRASFIEDNLVDQMSDAAKGIARLSDVNSNFRELKKSALTWVKEKFWSNQYVSKDDSKVALNYSDKYQQRYNNISESLEKMTDQSEVDKYAQAANISRSNYATEREYRNAIARKMAQEGFSKNFFVTTIRSIDLYYAQRTRNDVYPVAKMIQRQYESYRNYSGKSRDNANKRMMDYITRSIQKLNLESGDSITDKKLSNITILKNMLSRFDEMPIVKKILNKSLLKHMSDDEKMLYDTLKKAKEDINSDNEVKFSLDNIVYERKKVNGAVIYYKTINGNKFTITGEKGIANFREKLSQYYERRMSYIGADSTIQNIINLIRNLLLYKMLAGVSTSGIFNRIEGHLANSEMDATGYYWTPGNLNYVEKYFFGSWLNRYINRQGGKLLIRNEDKKQWKRLDIIRKISDQTNIFQDMKNQFDKTIEGEQKGVIRHNLDLFQLSVGNPEFKNQMSAVLAVLIDKKIKDKNDVEHPIFDKKTGEFTCFDIKDGELVLKDEFQREDGLNDSWVTFQSTVEKDGKAVISPSFEFAQQCKIMIKNIHGDYRQNSALGYNNNLILSHLMMLKRWLPQKVLRGWSEGGSVNEETGEFMENYDIMWHKNEQSGIWYDALTKAKSPLTALMPVILSTTKLHKGVLQTVAGTTASLYMIGKVIKDKLGAREGDIEHNISMLDETKEMTKALFWEIVAAPGRALKMDIDLSKRSFSDSDGRYKAAYGDITLGNFRACARTMATYFYLAALGVLVKLLFWHPEDGDDDDRRKRYNWIDNNLENILETTTSTMYMIDNFEDKSEVSNIPIIRWTNDLGKFVEACNEMNGDKAGRYAYKVFAPIRFPLASDNFNPFANQFEYQKDTWDDRLIKNIRTDGEWGSEQNYKHVRADIKRQYVEMWEDKKLPAKTIQEIEGMKSFKDLGYESVYDLPSDVFKDLVSKSSVIPSRRQKEYKDKDYKFMQDVLMDEYENNEFLQNHTLRYIFGGYDNRISAYWQRNASSEYNIIRDNPYIDDGD